MRKLRLAAFAVLASLLAASFAWPAAQRKKREEITQTLEIPKDPPPAVAAETSRLAFHVSQLTARGLLSQQLRDSLRDVERQAAGGAVVRLRAFVAGSGDVRRVQSVVSDYFTDRRRPIPALTVVQVGGLPLPGAQIVLEAVSVARQTRNPHGLAFISAQQASVEGPLEPVGALARKSIAELMTAVQAAGTGADDVLSVTCLLTTLSDVNDVRGQVYAAFPKAAANSVQTQRAAYRSVAGCEAVAKLKAPPGGALVMLNPEGLPRSPNYSQVALVGAPKVILSGAQLGFGTREEDVRLAFQRLEKAVEPLGGGLRRVAMVRLYPVSEAMAGVIRKVRPEFVDPASPPAATLLPFEGLPSLDASFALDVVAVP